MERDDKVNRVTECNCAFPILWFLSYLSLYKNTFNGSLDFIVPTKRSLYSKRAPLGLTKNIWSFSSLLNLFSCTSFRTAEHGETWLLFGAAVWKHGLLFWKDAWGRGREEGPFPESYLRWTRWLVLWEGWTVTLNQLQVAVAEAHLCEWPWSRTEERSTRKRITTALQLRTLGLIRVFYKSFAIHFGCSFIKGNNQKGLKRYCMFKLV